MIKSIKIGPIIYNISLVRKLNGINAEATGMAWLNGQVTWQDSLIEIEEGLNEDMRRAVLIHEAVHAVLEHAGITEHPESSVIALGYGLLQVLRDNPEFVAYITDRNGHEEK